MIPSVKTIGYVIVLVLFGGFLFLGADVVPYSKTAIDSMRGSVKGAIGEDFDLDRAELELQESNAELGNFRKKIAELEVDLEDQTKRKNETEKEIKALEQDLQGLTNAYENSGYGAISRVSWNGVTLSSNQVENRINSCVQRLDYLENHYTLLEKVIAERKSTLSRAEHSLSKGLNRKEELALLLESCRFELECDKVMGVQYDFEKASGSLGEAEKILAEVSKNSRVRKKVREDVDLEYRINNSHGATGAELVNSVRNRNRNLSGTLSLTD